ncbi:MAG: hypothetical protein QOG98_1577, partial [Pseudonocardiales bacterium]|nr:hypothetical protein [Pseudonocardiales bacterium]
MAECFGGESSVANGFLQQGPECVAELMGVKRGDAESSGELAADVLRAGGGEAVRAGRFARRLEADEQRGEWSTRAVRYSWTARRALSVT